MSTLSFAPWGQPKLQRDTPRLPGRVAVQLRLPARGEAQRRHLVPARRVRPRGHHRERRAGRAGRHHRGRRAGRARPPAHRRGRKGPPFEVRAKLVVVACGSLHTPLLLRASGLDSPAHRAAPHAAPGLPRRRDLRRSRRGLGRRAAERVQRPLRERRHHARERLPSPERARRGIPRRRAAPPPARAQDAEPGSFRRDDPRRRRRARDPLAGREPLLTYRMAKKARRASQGDQNRRAHGLRRGGEESPCPSSASTRSKASASSTSGSHNRRRWLASSARVPPAGSAKMSVDPRVGVVRDRRSVAGAKPLRRRRQRPAHQHRGELSCPSWAWPTESRPGSRTTGRASRGARPDEVRPRPRCPGCSFHARSRPPDEATPGAQSPEASGTLASTAASIGPASATPEVHHGGRAVRPVRQDRGLRVAAGQRPRDVARGTEPRRTASPAGVGDQPLGLARGALGAAARYVGALLQTRPLRARPAGELVAAGLAVSASGAPLEAELDEQAAKARQARATETRERTALMPGTMPHPGALVRLMRW